MSPHVQIVYHEPGARAGLSVLNDGDGGDVVI